MCCETEGDDLRTGLCDCADRWLHLHCQRKLLVTTSGNGKCTVCKAAFRNATCIDERRVNHRWLVGHSLLGAVHAGFIMSIVFFGMHICSILTRDTLPKELCAPTRNDVMKNSSLYTVRFACYAVSQIMIMGDIAIIMLILVCLTICGTAALLLNRFLRGQPRVLINRRWHLVDDDVGTRKPETVSLDAASG